MVLPARFVFSRKMKERMERIEREFAGRRLVIEAGRMAKQAAGSAAVQFGETMVLAAVTVSDTESPLPFFPLLVEYKDKAYAAGKIPGGFIKREGRPSDPEILKARIIDRSIRPLFPEGFKNEVQVFIYVISADQENDADVMALVAASYAIMMVEGGAIEVAEADILEAITVGHGGIKELIAIQEEMLARGRAEKMAWTKYNPHDELETRVKSIAVGPIV